MSINGIIKKFLLSGSLLFSILTHAQQAKNFRAVQWGLEHGLSQAETYFMLKDYYGFLWIGTRAGLNRFDGATFKIYTPDRRVRNGILSNICTNGMVEDSLHNIWIGTDKGVSRYDQKADTFSNLLPDLALTHSPLRSITPFASGDREVFCVESESLITSYDVHTLAKKVYTDIRQQGFQFVGPSANYSILHRQTMTVWILLYHMEDDIQELVQVSLKDGVKKTFILPVQKKRPGGWASAEAMCFDEKRNAIWLNTFEGLLKFSLNDLQFKRIPAFVDLTKNGAYDRFVGIDIDLQDRIWLATQPEGILIYDPDNDSLSKPFPDDDLLQRQVSEANACIYADPDGIIWSGFWSRKGIFQLLPFNRAVTHYKASTGKPGFLSSNVVFTMVWAGGDQIWLGSDHGLHVYNIRTGYIDRLSGKDTVCLKPKSDVSPIYVDTLAGKAWLWSNWELVVRETKSRKCRKLTFLDNQNKIISQLRFAVSGVSQTGFVVTGNFNNRQGIFELVTDTTMRLVLTFPEYFLNPFKTTLVEPDLLFVSGDTDSSYQTFRKTGNRWTRIASTFDSLHWTQIIFNQQDSSFWVAAEKKLFHFTKAFRIIRIYDQSNGLPESGIMGLIPDKQGNIWFHTEWSVHQLNIKTGYVSTLSEKDGLKKQDFVLLRLFCSDRNGDIYYSGGYFGEGFIRISPEKYISPGSSVYLQSLLINQKPFHLPAGINFLPKLSLRHFENKIEIETGIIDYYSKGKSRIRFKLEGEGLKEDWKYGPYYYTIRYEGLSPGHYRLFVQASNAANTFNGPEKILEIEISPPFWETWWFRILAALAAFAIIYGIVQWRSRQLRNKNIQLEEKVMHRTKELKHSLEELRETQQQLIEREKMASLGELTAGIAHEIQNPLNFVTNFSEINRELIAELRQERQTNQQDQVGEDKILADLDKNTDKINHHAKRADAIVKSMLQHSRTGTGQKEPFNLNALVEEYLRLSYHGFRAKEKTFNCHIEQNLDEQIGKIPVIPQEIGRVLLNLFNNALYSLQKKKSMNGNSYHPELIVRTLRRDSKVEIRIRDNGMGMPDAIRNKIFQPFFTTKPTGEGTGLGLSLSFDIITKMHQGELRVDAQEGEFAEFIIGLPL